MKQKKFYVNLYILIPVIFTGIMLLGIIVTYQLFSTPSLSSSSSINIYTLTMIFGAIAFLASYIMMRIFLKPLVDFVEVSGPFQVGDVRLTPLDVQHGRKMTGYLMESGALRVGYVPDCHAMPAETVKRLAGVDVMILDALRYRPHPSHICVQESLALLEQIAPRTAYLIHLCHDVEHDALEGALPSRVRVSYDGLRVRLEARAEGTIWTEEGAS